MSVVKSLDRLPVLLNIRNSIVEKNLTNVVYVSKLIPDLQGLLSIRGLNRNIINLVYMTMLLIKAQALGLPKNSNSKKPYTYDGDKTYNCSSLTQHQRLHCGERPCIKLAKKSIWLFS